LEIKYQKEKIMNFTASIYTNEPNVVMYLNGVKCKVSVEIIYDDYETPGMPINAKVNIEPTEEPLTVGIKRMAYQCRQPAYYKFGGFPVFLQMVSEPCSDDGLPYTYICTIENDWGDMGNGNIFALIRDFKVEDVYVEASCS
jgi:hypothetical protein